MTPLTSDDCESIRGGVIDRDRKDTQAFNESMEVISSMQVDWKRRDAITCLKQAACHCG